MTSIVANRPWFPRILGLATITALLFTLSSCAVWRAIFGQDVISSYDQKTVDNLEELRTEISDLASRFGNEEIKEEIKKEIAETNEKFEGAIKYEEDKGKTNKLTAQEFQVIKDKWDDTVQKYLDQEEGLGETFYKERARILEEAFEIAIADEKGKSKD